MSAKKYILNQTVGDINNALFKVNARDNAAEPYFHLKSEFKKLGFDFVGVSDQPIEEVSCVVFWDTASFGGFDYLRQWLRYIKQILHKANTRNMINSVIKRNDILKVLVLFEPQSVDRGNTNLSYHELFDIVLTWDPRLVDNIKYFQIYLPSPLQFTTSTIKIPFNQKKLLVDISGYKFNYHERSLSHFRMNEIRYFQNHYKDLFDLYGEGWNMSSMKYIKRKIRDWRLPREFFPSYRGTVDHKWDLFPYYKFSLCYENIADEPGFVSVKIFDCLRSGCVPVYRGASDIDEYVDSAAFIDRRKFSSSSELADFLLNINEDVYQKYIDSAQAYLNSFRFQRFLSKYFSDNIINIVVPRIRELPLSSL